MTLYFTGKLTDKIVDTYYTDRPDLKKKKKKKSVINFTFLGNCPPTPNLSQYLTVTQFGFCIIWRIMEIEEGVIRRGRITAPSEISMKFRWYESRIQ